MIFSWRGAITMKAEILKANATKLLMTVKNAESAYLRPETGLHRQGKKTAVHGQTNRSITKQPAITAQVSIPQRMTRLFLAFASILLSQRSEIIDLGPG
jgi:hypothetical protein